VFFNRFVRLGIVFPIYLCSHFSVLYFACCNSTFAWRHGIFSWRQKCVILIAGLRMSLYGVQWRTQKLFMGGFIQRHRVVNCIWCALFVTSQNDVIVLFPNQRFGEVCW